MKPKALVWGGSVARTPIGDFVVEGFLNEWHAERQDREALHWIASAPSIEEAQAACQAEFDRIWREMTDMEGST